VPLSPKEFQVQSDGVLHDEPVYLQVHEFDDVDVMEAFDAAPATQATMTATVELKEDVHGDNDNNDNDNQQQEQVIQTTRSGCVVQAHVRFDDIDWQEYDAAVRQGLSSKQLVQQGIRDNSDDSSDNSKNEEFHDSIEEEQQQDSQQAEEDDNSEAIEHIEDKDDELAAVSASLGGGFLYTAELKPLNYEQAMGGSDKGKWLESMDEEKGRFDKHKVVEAVQHSQVPEGTCIMTSTWVCKKKSNGTYHAQLNLCGFLQVEGEHYDAHSISSPVVTIITIHIVLTLLTVIVDWYAVLVDVRGAFLLGDWESDQQIYMEVPKGWTHHYPVRTVLRLLKMAYGAKQSAKRYWILWLTVMDEMGFTRSQADPCLYYKWHPEHGLLLMMSFIDDVCISGTRTGVELVKAELFTHFDCDDTGEMKEYVGNKVDRKNGAIKLTQPVLLQSLVDEFKIEHDLKVKNPAVPGTVLQPTENKLSPEDLFTYRSGTGKLLHLMKWS
jgi:Reverse transcriptase (RNA-dependent DNA polymerase)